MTIFLCLCGTCDLTSVAQAQPMYHIKWAELGASFCKPFEDGLPAIVML